MEIINLIKGENNISSFVFFTAPSKNWELTELEMNGS